jgi:phage terminase large subunit GpA-like protein
VQLRGIYYEIVAWAPNRESWVVDADVIAGDTTDHKSPAPSPNLMRFIAANIPTHSAAARTVDAFGVDSGFRSHVVYAWCADRGTRPLRLQGRRWLVSPALGGCTLQDIDLDGRKIAQGVKLWPIGTWPLKGIGTRI